MSSSISAIPKKHKYGWLIALIIIIVILVIATILLNYYNSTISRPIDLSAFKKYYIISNTGLSPVLPTYLNIINNAFTLSIWPITQWTLVPHSNPLILTNSSGIAIGLLSLNQYISFASSDLTLSPTTPSMIVISPKDKSDTDAVAGYTNKLYTLTSSNNILYNDNNTPKLGDSSTQTTNIYWRFAPILFQ
jgi:hypothetical protein